MADRATTRTSSRRNDGIPSQAKSSARKRPPASSQSLQELPRRTLRSQSQDVSDGELLQTSRKATRKGNRQTSVDSEGSLRSAEGSVGRASRKVARTKAPGDLSAVAEDPTIEYPELEDANTVGTEVDDGGKQSPVLEPEYPPQSSPGGFSSISGTTARTSHSAQELADLNGELILEALPDLAEASSKILNLVARPEASESDLGVIVKELKLPGSFTSKRLKRLEGSFMSHKEEFGSDHYISLSIILRALLGVRLLKDIGHGPWRPDPIIQKANLTILVTKTITSQRESQDTFPVLQQLDGVFPTPFLSTFSTQLGTTFGGSALLDETFNLALSIRTQLLIAMLYAHQDEANYDPDKILTHVFFELPERRDTQLSIYEDTLHNGRLKGWDVAGLGAGDTPLSNQFTNLILQRIQLIRQAFPEESQAMSIGDFADLEQLERMFSWLAFTQGVVSWAALRFEEIDQQLNAQGGLETMQANLEIEMRGRVAERTRGIGRDGEVVEEEEEEEEELPDLKRVTVSEQVLSTPGVLDGEARLLPAAVIGSSAAVSSFLSPSAIARLREREAARPTAPSNLHLQANVNDAEEAAIHSIDSSSSKADPSTQPQTSRLSRSPAEVRSAASAKIIAEVALGDDEDLSQWRSQDVEDEDGPLNDLNNIPIASQNTQALIQTLKDKERENDKENIRQRVAGAAIEGVEAKKRFFIERQANAERVDFDDESQASHQPEAAERRNKRSRAAIEESGSVNEEDVFQQDDRKVDVASRRIQAPVAQRRSAVPPSQPASSPKRVRVMQPSPQLGGDEEDNTQDAVDRQVNDAINAQNLASSQRGTPINTQDVNDLAKRVVAARSKQKVQTRHPWSEEATNRFVEVIEEFGTSWSKIAKLGEPLFEGRDQVGLKDKARNLKVDFLKSQTALPINFDLIKLNRNQIQKVQDLGIPYEQESARDVVMI
ncbi:MAG: hypothetical protein M1827_007409 [Pycnora praestabilis]|nr:MAG: hypothetical protein M1827_007409 [Pycnora praestabilis]